MVLVLFHIGRREKGFSLLFQVKCKIAISVIDADEKSNGVGSSVGCKRERNFQVVILGQAVAVVEKGNDATIFIPKIGQIDKSQGIGGRVEAVIDGVHRHLAPIDLESKRRRHEHVRKQFALNDSIANHANVGFGEIKRFVAVGKGQLLNVVFYKNIINGIPRVVVISTQNVARQSKDEKAFGHGHLLNLCSVRRAVVRNRDRLNQFSDAGIRNDVPLVQQGSLKRLVQSQVFGHESKIFEQEPKVGLKCCRHNWRPLKNVRLIVDEIESNQQLGENGHG